MVIARWTQVGLLVMALILPGCGGSVPAPPKEDLVPVKGTVKLGGKPTPGINVMFVPTGSIKGNGSSATTGADGSYELRSNATKKPGIPTGTYVVQFSKLVGPDGSPLAPDKAPTGGMPSELIPPDWRDSDKSGDHNSVTVPAGGKTFDFDIPAK
jgi:hypothetical protein